MEDMLSILKKTGAILKGHFIGTSGKHLSTYVNKNKIFLHTDITSRLCSTMAERVVEWKPDVVVAPATGGIALSQWTAFHLSTLMGKEVLSVYTEQIDGVHSLNKRGYEEVVKGRNVLVVEDIVNTGKSIQEVIRAVIAADGSVVGAISLINENENDMFISEMLGVPYRSLLSMPLDVYTDDEVPEWLTQIPINTEVGHGKKYLESKNASL